MIWIVRLAPAEAGFGAAFEALTCFGALAVLDFLDVDTGSSTGAAAAVRFWVLLRFAIVFVGLIGISVVMLNFF